MYFTGTSAIYQAKSFGINILNISPLSGIVYEETPAKAMIPIDRGVGGYPRLEQIARRVSPAKRAFDPARRGKELAAAVRAA